jgi:hypothetical protein
LHGYDDRILDTSYYLAVSGRVVSRLDGMVHGDEKLRNAVRVVCRLRLVDFHASVTTGEGSFAGAGICSGHR